MNKISEQLSQNTSSKTNKDFTIEKNRLIKYNGSDSHDLIYNLQERRQAELK